MAAITGQQPDLHEAKGWRRTKNRIATVAMVVAFVLVVIPLVFVLITVVARGIGIISWQFLTGSIPPQVEPADVGGIGPAVAGTLEIVGLATLMAVLTGVPSIVMGLFVFSIWVLHFGFSGLAGAIALGCLMLPVVIRSTHEMLKLVPNPLREGSYALGATKSRVTMTVVLPAAVGGIVSGALLAVARAAGETAPLLFTILTVTTVNRNVFSGPNTSIPSQIFANAISPYTGAQDRAWGAALTLIVIAFVLMIAARIITARFTR